MLLTLYKGIFSEAHLILVYHYHCLLHNETILHCAMGQYLQTYSLMFVLHALFGFCSFWDKVSCIPSWPWSHYAVEDDLELLIALSLCPECWDDRHALLNSGLCGTGNQIQGFVYTRQALLNWIASLSPTVICSLPKKCRFFELLAMVAVLKESDTTCTGSLLTVHLL